MSSNFEAAAVFKKTSFFFLFLLTRSKGQNLWYSKLVMLFAQQPSSPLKGNIMTSRIVLSYCSLVTLYSFYYTYNSFTLPFQGRTLNTGAAEANLRGFPLPQAPGGGAILQFLTSISKCKEARNFRLGIFRSANKYHASADDGDRNRFHRMQIARATYYATLTRLYQLPILCCRINTT